MLGDQQKKEGKKKGKQAKGLRAQPSGVPSSPAMSDTVKKSDSNLGQSTETEAYVGVLPPFWSKRLIVSTKLWNF
jgi:hypothetical protein